MNDFLQQFAIESRELVDQASDGLLILERSANDKECLDAVFRAFHTLKGGAGIVEFPAMERAVHAAEDVLSAARSGKRPLTTELVGYCLACLDRVVQWLDTLETTGELPVDADAQADSVINRFKAAGDTAVTAGQVTDNGVAANWSAGLLERNPTLQGRATSAVRFVPDPECLYRGADPVARMTALPALLAFDMQPVSAWPALGSLDPFACNLVLTALTASSVSDVNAHMKGHSGECEVVAIGAAASAVAQDSTPTRHVRALLEAQLALVDAGKPQSFAGRVASAGLTAANVMRFAGRADQVAALTQATEKSLAERSPLPLQDAIRQALAVKAATSAGTPERARVDITPRTLRVDAERIDALVRLTGELTVEKNALGHLVKLSQAGGDSVAGALKERHGILEHLIGELQRSILAMRVLPLRTVLQRFPRVVREMSSSIGKPVRLTLEGDETEADKAIVEMLFEPLLHIVRNSLDHGVETAAERATLGKPPVATILIRAARQADRVLIEVGDDGRGIDVDRVRAVALDRGVVTAEGLRVMTESDVIDLIFAPGFSTAAEVTELSGRGVGMDAVRTTVERIGGRVSVESLAGQGATVRFALPFSVMMTHVMTVEAGGQMFGIPLDAVVETVRVPTDTIVGVGAAQAIVLRNRTIPVLELAAALGVGQATRTESAALIVITSIAGQFAGIHVDRLGERMEIILKPLEGLLAGTPGITGTTLLGDGRILLVLDIGELLE